MQDNWDIRSIEKSNWIWLLETSHLFAAELKLNSESLEVDNNENHNYCCDQVEKIWCILPIECLLQAIQFVWFCEHEMEKSNDSTFEFSSLVSSDCHWGE